MKASDTFLAEFFRKESAGGIVLIIATVLAMILANTPFQTIYIALIETPVTVRIGALEIAKPLLLWINDGLMAVFFFLVGLELKRELLEGHLSSRRQVILPAIGAVGGMAIPALIYVFFNAGDSVALQGWAIPAATDIAFALGILSLLGSRVPVGLKVFLTSVAIFDDIGAIVIIALFYTAKISLGALLVVLCCIPVLFFLNKKRVESRAVYLFFGIIMWVAMLKSGVHATLTGVILALFIPMKSGREPGFSPLKELEHDLHSLVAFIILPVFAFANAGVPLTGVGIDQLVHGVPVGIALGLFAGKQIGIFGFSVLAIKAGAANLPEGVSWKALYGTAALCGIGFTMSLFIGSLAFEESGVNLLFDERLGILIGSLASGIVGYIIIRSALGQDNRSA
ncbi:MAG: Na+/H+ antiporter NhaA [Candidatus Marinimicrobia bacterium]|nr:Na+/H+ antiporter NhaA [Candidatus Neomarinimicrobiota bacterium]MCF7830277.1 Na+/H+ antiporter NhaA [Candidatus Neomarinimicrobiota bacterium]MCF7882186.1 Na+/H+ antiporter NhaA [Candidatus Neomarinimicrobiota bacterium]